MSPWRTVSLALILMAAAGWAAGSRPEAPAARGADAPPPANDPGPSPGSRHALLVGCTVYPNLDQAFWLEGPANDMHLMADLLHVKYGFPKENITVLSEEEGQKDPSRLPTRANIERECRKLAREAREGDQIVVQLSGHGSRQPEDPDVKDPQPDGCDKIFLPRDVGKWTGEEEKLLNAIRGRDLGDWLRPIPAKKALLWVVLDACHSGEMVRAVDEKAREVDPTAGLGIPQAALDKAAQRARQRAPQGEKARGAAEPVPAMPLPREEGVVALYACQSTEVTVEKKFPVDSPDAKPYGLLTYTISRILQPAGRKLTYRELVQAIQAEYDAMGRRFPTPVLQGADASRVVLGQEKLGRPSITVARKGDALVVNAGSLHGLTPGSVLAVSDDNGKPLGFVSVTEAIRALEAPVVPCADPDAPAGQKAPVAQPDALVGGHCRVARLDFGDLRVKVAVDPHDPKGQPAPEGDRQRVTQALEKLAREAGTPVKVLRDPAKAEWLIRLDAGNLELVRGAEAVRECKEKGDGADCQQEAAFLLGKLGSDDEVLSLLRDKLGQVVRAQQLLSMARATEGVAGDDDDDRPSVKVVLRRRGTTDRTWQPVEAPLNRVYGGDLVRYELTNPEPYAVDVTVLYVDSGFGITSLFPIQGDVNRLEPREKPRHVDVDESSTTTGREHIVVIAVRGKGPAVDFSTFTQPTLEKVKVKSRSVEGGSQALNSPLGQILQRAMYGEGGQRAASRAVIEAYRLDVIPVQVGARPPEK